MPKRKRRERDRPKAGPNALYNPYKRVLLSYGSDEEEESQEESLLRVRYDPAAYISPTNQDDQQEGDVEEEHDAEQHTEDVEGEGSVEEEDEQNESESEDDDTNDGADDSRKVPSKGCIRRNEVTGQVPALGALSFQWDVDEGDDEENDGEDEGAMAYLRAVRLERQSMPTVLTASANAVDEPSHDTNGYLSEGTYIARPTNLTAPRFSSSKSSVTAQEAFTHRLKTRFLNHRAQMLAPTSTSTSKPLDANTHPIHLSETENKAYATWTRLLRTIAPQSAQIRAMTSETVFRLLDLVDRSFLARGKDISKMISVWIWALLARLDDVGTMNNDEVFRLRELGKKAVLVRLSFRDAVSAERLEGLVEEQEGGREEVRENAHDTPGSSEETRPVLGTPNQPEVLGDERENTLATLDMIITIVGDVFGQRDLLEFRQGWETARN